MKTITKDHLAFAVELAHEKIIQIENNPLFDLSPAEEAELNDETYEIHNNLRGEYIKLCVFKSHLLSEINKK